jgi:hypothetical protein
MIAILFVGWWLVMADAPSCDGSVHLIYAEQCKERNLARDRAREF